MTQEEKRQQLKQQIAALETELSQLDKTQSGTQNAPPPPVQQPYPYTNPMPNQQMRQPYAPFNAPPVPPVSQKKKRDVETGFGKNVLGILASALILVGVVLLAYASGSKLVQLLGIFFVGGFLTVVGLFGARRKASAFRNFFLIFSGCGTGILYLGLFLAYWYYQLIPALVLYLLLLAWIGLMYLLSRYRSLVFQIIGQIGTLVSIALLYPRGFFNPTFYSSAPWEAIQRVLWLTGFILIAMVFYCLTNQHRNPHLRLIPFYLSGICSLFLTARLSELTQIRPFFSESQWRIYEAIAISGIVLLCLILLFQYGYEIRYFSKSEPISTASWLLRYLPTVGFVCILLSWLQFILDGQGQNLSLLLSCLGFLGFWVLAQKSRDFSFGYLVALLLTTGSILVFLFRCTPAIRLLDWGILLLILCGIGRYRGFSCYYKLAYGLFLFLSWALLPSVFSALPYRTVLQYAFVFFSLCNCLVLFYFYPIRQDKKLHLLPLIGNFLAMMILWTVPLERPQLLQQILFTISSCAVYLINSGNYFQETKKENPVLQLFFALKHFVLVLFLEALWHFDSFWLFLGWCGLALIYTALGISKSKTALTISGWSLELATMVILLFYHNNPSRILCAAVGFGILYCFHRYPFPQAKSISKLTKRFFAIPCAGLLLLGLWGLYCERFSALLQWIFLPILGAGILALGWFALEKFHHYRSFATSIAGTGFAILLLYLLLHIPSDTIPYDLVLCIPLLLWVLLGCILGKRRPDCFQPLTTAGALISAIVLLKRLQPINMLPSQTSSIQWIWNYTATLAFLLISLALITKFTYRGNKKDDITLLIANSIALLSLLLGRPNFLYTIATKAEYYQAELLLTTQFLFLFGAYLFQYSVQMHHYHKTCSANDKVWLLHYLPTLCSLALISMSWTTSASDDFDVLASISETTALFWESLPFFASAVLIFGFWIFAQKKRMPTTKHNAMFLLTQGCVFLLLLLAPEETVWVRLGFWLGFLLILTAMGLCKRRNLYVQTSYALFLFGTSPILYSLFSSLSMRQTYTWIFAITALINCVVTLFCRKKRSKKLNTVSIVYNAFAMIVISFLLISNINFEFLHDIFYLSLPEKILLAVAEIATFSLQSGQLLQNRKSKLYEFLFGFKYTILLAILLCGFEAPKLLLTICLILLAMGEILFGFCTSRKVLRIYGLYLMLLSICKLTLFDISYDRLFQRAIGFLLCGLCCFGISFLYYFMNGKLGQRKQTHAEEK